MKSRPLMFIILGILHLLEPFIKVLHFKFETGFPFERIISNLLTLSNFKDIFEFWILFPLGGLALLSIKRWSWFLFMAVHAYSIYIHFTYEAFTWPYLSETPLFSSLLLVLLNTGLIIFFFLPSLRKIFFNKNMRWWESKTRYHIKFPCSISFTNPNDLKDCFIRNISLSGAFIDYKGVVADGTHLTINMSFEGRYISLDAIKISTHAFNGVRGAGIQFHYKNIFEQLKMARLLKRLVKRHDQYGELFSPNEPYKDHNESPSP